MRILSLALVSLIIVGGCAAAQPVAQPATRPVTPSSLQTPLAPGDLDAGAYAQWVAGAQTPVDGDARGRAPQWVIWTTKSSGGHSGVSFGASKTAGARHLRIGFKRPIPIGSVLVRGGGTLSVLKPNATYPGDLSNDAAWTPAQRLLKGQPSRAEVVGDDYAIWTLPPNTATRALRFTHVAGATDAEYAGLLGGALVLNERVSNLAPLALTTASSISQDSDRINNESNDGTWDTWMNRARNDVTARPVVSAENPEWLMLSWPAPVKLNGLELLWAGFSSATVQSYAGPADRAPRDARESDWRDVGAFDGINKGYPALLWPNHLEFGTTVNTRAIRLKITAPTDEKGPHMGGKTHDGKRVWLGELMALAPLQDAPLQTVSFATNAEASHPPIPIRFRLEKPGLVTLVIEKSDGTRVRNLIAETPFPAGDNVAWWDGTDDLGRDIDAANHGVYHLPAQLVAPGTYRVRGLVHDAIVPRYEFSVYSPGTPPWETADKTGGWTTNHSPPQAALFLPAAKAPGGKPLIYLGSYVSEGGSGLAWVDQNGVKQGGRGWIGGNWTAAPYLSADNGPKAVAGAYAYVASVWTAAKGSATAELRVTALTEKGDSEVIRTQFPARDATDIQAEISGLAVRDGLIAVALPRQNKITFARAGADAKTGKISGAVVGSAPLEDARGLVFDGQGRLLALVGNELRRYAVAANGALSAPQTLVKNLQDPRGLTLDGAGNIYISDWGASHQVKVFDGAGQTLRTIGKAGAPVAGPYDPAHMNHPHGMAIDGNGRLWVTENDYLPKRVSVWNGDGSLWKAFYGPGKYGGGGTLDPNDKTRFIYANNAMGTLEFKLDWQSGTSRLTHVLVRHNADDMAMPFRASAPELPLTYDGRRYLTNSFNTNPTSGHGTALIYLERDGAARPVAAMGDANQWDLLKSAPFKASWPVGAKTALFAWSDLDGDGRAQPAEVSYRAASSVDGVTVMPDLSFVIARVGAAAQGAAAQGAAAQGAANRGATGQGATAMRFAPTHFTAAGAPRYDASGGEVIVAGAAPPASSGGGQMLTTGTNGWSVITLGVEPLARQSISGVKNGAAKWSYPSLWPGLHASHSAPQAERPGELLGTTRLLGGFFAPRGSDVGPLWALNSNLGNPYIFTADGVFVTTLFRDFRQGEPWAMPVAQRDANLSELSLGQENFWPSLTQTPDGQIYLVSGRNSSVLRLDGLETLRALPTREIQIGANDLKAAQTHLLGQEAARQQTHGSGILQVAVGAVAPVVDGKMDDWKNANWVDIDKSGVAAFFNSKAKPYDVTGALAISGDRLFVAYRTGDARLLRNSGEVPTAPFLTGGALDLMLGTDANADPKRGAPIAGDLRLLVTLVKGKPKAVLYRAVVAGARDPVPFSSPWRTISFDEVKDVSDQIQLAGADGNYEFSIPLRTLNLRPQIGQNLSGDIGVLRGDGAQTTTRVYWSNKASGLVSDVPAEAMLSPQLWGRMELVGAR